MLSNFFIISFLFLIYFIDYAITVVPFFLPFILLHPVPSLPPSFPQLSSCPWVIHTSYLASLFPVLVSTFPCLFCTYHLCFLFPVPCPPFSHLSLLADNPPCDLYLCESVPILVCLVCFCFLFFFLRFSC